MTLGKYGDYFRKEYQAVCLWNGDRLGEMRSFGLLRKLHCTIKSAK